MSTSSTSVAEPLRRMAVIEIGTTSVRMAIAESHPNGTWQTLESLVQSVAIGEDTYSTGKISRETIEICIRLLKTYRDKLKEYRIQKIQDIRVVATSAVREAENTLSFIDRIYIATGWVVDVLDVSEIHRVIYQALQVWRSKLPSLTSDRWIIAEVGGGNTEYLVLEHGEVEFAGAVRIGSLRLRAMLEKFSAPASRWPQLMRNHIYRSLIGTPVLSEQSHPHKLLLLGGEMRFLVDQLGDSKTNDGSHLVSLQDLESFTERILHMNVDEIVREFHLSLPDAEMLSPALITNTELAKLMKCSDIHVLPATVRDGLLQELLNRGVWSDELVKQILFSAIDVGRKFHFDEQHAQHVARLSRLLFNQLAPLHGLDRQFELLLVLSALLHEIGLFVSTSGYHKHSMYLINNSELFGIGRKHLMLIGLIARYHRRASPKTTHTGFTNLDRDHRVIVTKLAAILRIAIALDGSRNQRIHDLECLIDRNRLVISVADVSDLSMEQLALRQVGTLFEETFGLPILLRGQSGYTLFPSES